MINLYKEDGYTRLACPACHSIKLRAMATVMPYEVKQVSVHSKCLDCDATLLFQVILGAKRITVNVLEGKDNG
jgi:C4-type Zn-finger protein